MTELQNLIENFNNKFNQAEEKKSVNLKTGYLKLSSQRNKKKKKENSEESLHELWDTIKRNNLHITGAPEREERKKGAERFFKEIIADNFPNLGRNLDVQVHEFIGLQKVSTQEVLLQDSV